MTTQPTQHEAKVRALIGEIGPLVAHQQLIAENDPLLLAPYPGEIRDVLAARTAIYTVPIAEWAREQRERLGYTRPFAVLALGGTGRDEMTPRSDIDVALLFEDRLEDIDFLTELHRQTVNGTAFERTYGFRITPFPFAMEDIPGIKGKDLNSFLDMRAIYDPVGLAPTFRRRLRENNDSFAHFLYVRSFWKRQFAEAAPCERTDRFDIKADALRIFQGAVWTLAISRFQHSHEIYRSHVDSRDLDAYYFLLRIRSWAHLRRSTRGSSGAMGHHSEDVLEFADFKSLGEMLGPSASEAERFDFGNETFAALLSARRRVFAFAQGVIERELQRGRQVCPESPVTLGPSGLRYSSPQPPCTAHGRSRAAVFLLYDAMRYSLPIDPSELRATFEHAGNWMERVPEIAQLFTNTEGSIADIFEFIRQIDGMEERIFPGRRKFEASFDEGVLSGQTEIRSVVELRKLRELERFIAEGRKRYEDPAAPVPRPATNEEASPVVAAYWLGTNHLTAVKLALKTKRLSVTASDIAARDDTSRPLYERYSSGFSGIPLSEYYQRIGRECGFNAETIEETEFIIANRRVFKTHADAGWTINESVEKLRALCGDEQRLHALYTFTCADCVALRDALDQSGRWFLMRELYLKTLEAFRKTIPDLHRFLAPLGLDPDQQCVLADFGSDFFAGLYRRHMVSVASPLIKLAASPDSAAPPRVKLLPEGAGLVLGVAARDFPGLAACISGALWKAGVTVTQAHFFSAMNQRLALDFFHLHPTESTLPENLPAIVENAIHSRRHIADTDEASIPAMHGTFTLTESRPGKHCLRFESARNEPGIIYALTYEVFRHLGGSIHGLSAHTARGSAYISIYHSPPLGRGIEEARKTVNERF